MDYDRAWKALALLNVLLTTNDLSKTLYASHHNYPVTVTTVLWTKLLLLLMSAESIWRRQDWRMTVAP